MLVLAWAVPVATHLCHADWLLPALMLLGTASLLTGAPGLLDRVVLAGALLAGLACAMGLVWSWWPWHLSPVAIAGSSFTVLVLVMVGRGGASLPRPRWWECVAGLGALGVTVVVSWPYLRARTFTEQLAQAMAGEDIARHFAAFDAIRRFGTYVFLDRVRTASMAPSSMRLYPQGWHFIAATLDVFIDSSQTPHASPVVSFQHYVAYDLAVFGYLTLSIIWAAWWVAGRLLDGPRRMVVASFAVAVCLGTELVRMIVYGYGPETMGMAMMVVLIAMVVRPLRSSRQQVVLVGALLIGVGFVYFFFLPPAALFALVWLVRDWRRVRHDLVTVGIVAAAAMAIAPLPFILGMRNTKQIDALTVGGTLLMSVDGLLVLAFLVLCGVVAGRRSRIWRNYSLVVACACVYAAVIAAQSLAAGQSPRYYFGKTLHLILAILAIGIGAVATLFPPPWRLRANSRRRSRLATAVPAALLCLSVFALFGVFFGKGIFQQQFIDTSTTWTQAWVQGEMSRPRDAEVVMAARQAYPPVPGTITIILTENPVTSYRNTLFYAGLYRIEGRSERAIAGLPRQEPARTLRILQRYPKEQIRLVAVDPATTAMVLAAVRARPEYANRVIVVTLPDVFPATR